MTTPFGRAGFSALLKPSTKFNPDGEFNAKIILDDGPETSAFIDQLQGLYDQAYETNLAAARADKPRLTSIKRADPPFRRVVDEDTGAELPQWSVNARMKAVRKDKDGNVVGTQAPIILDSRNKPVHTEIGSGSVIRFQANAFPFFTAALGSGLQLRLIGVQVKELVPFSGSRPDFDEVDGFVETAQAQAPATPPQAARETPAPVDTTSDDSAEWV